MMMDYFNSHFLQPAHSICTRALDHRRLFELRNNHMRRFGVYKLGVFIIPNTSTYLLYLKS